MEAGQTRFRARGVWLAATVSATRRVRDSGMAAQG